MNWHGESAENTARSQTRAQHVRVTAVLGELPGTAFRVSLSNTFRVYLCIWSYQAGPQAMKLN